MISSKIIATGSFLPEKIVTNNELAKDLNTSDEWIKTRCGIKQRHIVSSETTSFMAEQASLEAIRRADVSPDSIDLVIAATCSGDQVFPSLACDLQQVLGLKSCPAFDVSVACSGFAYAMVIAHQFIQSGSCKRALVVGSEAMSRVVDWQDRSTCVLFGDGAGACILEATDNLNSGILAYDLQADGSNPEALCLPNTAATKEQAFIKMEGNVVFKKAVSVLTDTANRVLQQAQVTISDVAWLIPHQANIRIIDAVAKRLAIDMAKVVVSVDNHANTSAASIPLALDLAINDGRIKRGQLLLLLAVGGGLTWGSLLIKY